VERLAQKLSHFLLFAPPATFLTRSRSLHFRCLAADDNDDDMMMNGDQPFDSIREEEPDDLQSPTVPPRVHGHSLSQENGGGRAGSPHKPSRNKNNINHLNPRSHSAPPRPDEPPLPWPEPRGKPFNQG
jgi:hypothetical protein